MKKLVTCGAVAFAVAVMLVFSLLMMLAGAGGANAGGSRRGPGGGLSDKAPIPPEIRKLIEEAVKGKYGCPEVTASLLAAQLYTESNWEDKPSPVGAEGIAQFMPETWAEWGVDGDGDGVKNVHNPADAVPSAVRYDCVVADEVKNVPGNKAENMLAAYNAGSRPVIKAGGVPPIEETRGYVKDIRELAQKWGTKNGDLIPAGGAGSAGAERAIAAAMTALDTPYVWGGSCESPYSAGQGCDCSSLTQMAWGAAGVNLPRTTYEQVNAGTPVQSIAQLVPGDLLFSVGSASAPEHVGMYIGNDQVIEAPRTGLDVRIKPMSWWTNQIVAMRHIS